MQPICLFQQCSMQRLFYDKSCCSASTLAKTGYASLLLCCQNDCHWSDLTTSSTINIPVRAWTQWLLFSTDSITPGPKTPHSANALSGLHLPYESTRDGLAAQANSQHNWYRSRKCIRLLHKFIVNQQLLHKMIRTTRRTYGYPQNVFLTSFIIPI